MLQHNVRLKQWYPSFMESYFLCGVKCIDPVCVCVCVSVRETCWCSFCNHWCWLLPLSPKGFKVNKRFQLNVSRQFGRNMLFVRTLYSGSAQSCTEHRTAWQPCCLNIIRMCDILQNWSFSLLGFIGFNPTFALCVFKRSALTRLQSQHKECDFAVCDHVFVVVNPSHLLQTGRLREMCLVWL